MRGIIRNISKVWRMNHTQRKVTKEITTAEHKSHSLIGYKLTVAKYNQFQHPRLISMKRNNHTQDCLQQIVQKILMVYFSKWWNNRFNKFSKRSTIPVEYLRLTKNCKIFAISFAVMLTWHGMNKLEITCIHIFIVFHGLVRYRMQLSSVVTRLYVSKRM